MNHAVFNYWMHVPLQIQWGNIMNADFLKKRFDTYYL